MCRNVNLDNYIKWKCYWVEPGLAYGMFISLNIKVGITFMRNADNRSSPSYASVL